MAQLPYVPILKGKQGEFRALAELTAPDRARLRPMIDVPPIPSTRSPADHYAAQAAALRHSWPADVPIFIDSHLVKPSVQVEGEHPAAQLFRATASFGMHAIPVTGLRREPRYQVAVRDAAREVGACIRLEDPDPEFTWERRSTRCWSGSRWTRNASTWSWTTGLRPGAHRPLSPSGRRR